MTTPPVWVLAFSSNGFLRLGYQTVRAEGDAIFQGNAIVMLYPHVGIGETFRQRLVDYVARGGRLLVIDAGMGDVASTSNQILSPFGLSLDYNESWPGKLVLKDAWPGIQVEHAFEVRGGKSFATLNGERTVCATAEYGKGLVMVVSFGTMFNDLNMGKFWSHDPTPEERTRYDVLFAILRRLVKDDPAVIPPSWTAPSALKAIRPARVRPRAKPPVLPIPPAELPLKLPEPMDSGLEPKSGKK